MSNKKDELEIEFLDPRSAVRRRYGMYIGSAANANVLLREIVDNSLDEVSAGFGNVVMLSNNFNDGWIFVGDQGRGVPITYSKDKPDTTQAYLSISELHSGSKFNKSESISTGTNGVGASCCNFLSSNYILMSKITEDNYNKSIPEVYDLWNKSIKSKKDLFYIVVTEKGEKVFEGAGKLKELEKTIFKACGKNYISIPQGLSTIVLFKPDPEIFESTKAEIPWRNLQNFMLIQEKFYKRKVDIIVDGQSLKNTYKPYKFEFVKTIIPKDTSENDKVGMYVTFEVDENLSKGSEEGSVNGLVTDTGLHINLTKTLYKTALKDYFKIKHDCILNGLKFKVIVLANEVMFSSQTKENLKSITKVNQKDFVDVAKEFEKIFRNNSDYWTEIVEKLDFLADSMKKLGAAAKAQKMIDQASGRDMYRNKLELSEGFSDATCPSSERMKAELFLCEGLSPAGSLKAGRKDTRYAAVMALRGKTLNTSEKSAEQMLDNKELNTIFKVIGLGLDVNNVTQGCNTREEAWSQIQKYSRYGKICIAVDSDPDGDSIKASLLYTFSKFARFLIDFGMVYIAEGPEFIQDGKYYYPSDEKVPGTILPVGLNPNKRYRHIKGLGSLNRGDIYDAFYNPATRRLIQVTPEGLDYAMGLVESIDNRKNLLKAQGILTNPYGFSDL